MASRKPGLDYAYDKARRTLLATVRDGDPCALCRQPMFTAYQRLSADHYPARAVAQQLGVIPILRPVHLKCNVRAGQRLGGQVSAARRRQARRW